MGLEKTAKVYSLQGCVVCGMVAEELKRQGWDVTVLSLHDGNQNDPVVRKSLLGQCGSVPVVLLNGVPANLQDILRRKEMWE